MNMLEVKDTGAPLFGALLFASVGFFFGSKYEAKYPSQNDYKSESVLDVLWFCVLVGTAGAILLFSLFINADWSFIFS